MTWSYGFENLKKIIKTIISFLVSLHAPNLWIYYKVDRLHDYFQRFAEATVAGVL